MIISAALAGVYAVMKRLADSHTEPADVDKENPYLRSDDNFGEKAKKNLTVYEVMVKPFFDRILSFTALLFLSPLFALISLVIYIDDPGPVFFTQTRVGKDKKFFALHKFRSMKRSAPHDVPTHLLDDPERYITKVGRVLRKTSLDELPQIWDIFRGRMSIIGPRPALWNQEDLVAEREKYDVNSVMPGLTGLAQINGRDELKIKEKARLDGTYVEILRCGNLKGFALDVKCFIKTIASVLKSDGVVEGGTDTRHKQRKKAAGTISISPADAGFDDYGYKKKFHINTGSTNQKKVLITGADSYIGESFRQYAMEHYGKNFTVETLDMMDDSWREKDFSPYDVVFHVAGIAHADVGHIDETKKARYYAVNRDLAVKTADKAKAEGVRQLIFMSSMIIYGDSAPYGKKKVIDEHTLPAPSNFYGDSKWQADKAVRKLGSDTFRVAVLRPPMIYGKGSKGNYSKLAKLAKKLPMFPEVENQRSMLYIENLCEFLCLLMLSGEGGVYFPQNEEYARVTDVVNHISAVSGKRIWNVKFLVPVVMIACRMPGKIGRLGNKAFGNIVYCQKLSIYSGLQYRRYSLDESIKFTEQG